MQRRGAQQSNDPGAYEHAVQIAREVADHGYEIDRSASRLTFERMIAHAVRAAPTTAMQLIGLARRLGLEVDLSEAQETVYDAAGASEPGEQNDKLEGLMRALSIAPSVAQKSK